MSKGDIIAAQWQSYQYSVMPFGAPAVQVQECRRAFYAGAQSMLASIMGMLDADAEPTDEDLEKMEAISRELQRFMEDVFHGRA